MNLENIIDQLPAGYAVVSEDLLAVSEWVHASDFKTEAGESIDCGCVCPFCSGYDDHTDSCLLHIARLACIPVCRKCRRPDWDVCHTLHPENPLCEYEVETEEEWRKRRSATLQIAMHYCLPEAAKPNV